MPSHPLESLRAISYSNYHRGKGFQWVTQLAAWDREQGGSVTRSVELLVARLCSFMKCVFAIFSLTDNTIPSLSQLTPDQNC